MDISAADPHRLFCTPALLLEDPLEADALRAASRSTISFDGDDLSVYRWGSGPVLLLCHGWGAWAAYVAPYAFALAGAGFTAVAPDTPAHTPPARAAPGTIQTTAVDFARALATVAEAVADGPFNGVVGHSFGGMAAAFALADVPDGPPLLRANRLVLVSAPDRLGTLLDVWLQAADAQAPSVGTPDGPVAQAILDGVRRRFGHAAAAFSVSAHASRPSPSSSTTPTAQKSRSRRPNGSTVRSVAATSS